MHSEHCTQSLTLLTETALAVMPFQRGSHSWRALLRRPAGQGLGNAELHQRDDAIYECGHSWREVQAQLLLCLAVVDLLLRVILLLWNIRNSKLRKPLLHQSHV